jgi:hypothetical protein
MNDVVNDRKHCTDSINLFGGESMRCFLRFVEL